ncbi:MAG: dTDP-glucose 4,6-dehydratase [Planctomycetes bacterium]|nr:dTDP-glucose 4,6-dehydratase [Planctomycetota bacterium]
MTTTILVTGGCGFIGSNFIHHLHAVRNSWKVVCVDALTYAGNLGNLDEIRSWENFTFERASIADRGAMDEVFSAHKIDYVVNFAAETHVDRSIEDATNFILTNVGGTQVLLDSERAHGVKRHLQVGTDEVYGSLGVAGFFVETMSLHPNSPYAASKASADLLCLAAHHTHAQDVVITRCSNNYGPYQFPEKMIPLMLRNALSDKQLPVYGDGMNVRDWLYVEDHLKAILLVLEKGRAGEVYNVGGHNEWHNIDLVKHILNELGKPESLIKFVEDRKGHDLRYAIDPEKIASELGWKPETMFPEGIKKTIKWYSDNQKWLDDVTSGDYLEYYNKMYKVDSDGTVTR